MKVGMSNRKNNLENSLEGLREVTEAAPPVSAPDVRTPTAAPVAPAAHTVVTEESFGTVPNVNLGSIEAELRPPLPTNNLATLKARRSKLSQTLKGLQSRVANISRIRNITSRVVIPSVRPVASAAMGSGEEGENEVPGGEWLYEPATIVSLTEGLFNLIGCCVPPTGGTYNWMFREIYARCCAVGDGTNKCTKEEEEEKEEKEEKAEKETGFTYVRKYISIGKLVGQTPLDFEDIVLLNTLCPISETDAEHPYTIFKIKYPTEDEPSLWQRILHEYIGSRKHVGDETLFDTARENKLFRDSYIIFHKQTKGLMISFSRTWHISLFNDDEFTFHITKQVVRMDSEGKPIINKSTGFQNLDSFYYWFLVPPTIRAIQTTHPLSLNGRKRVAKNSLFKTTMTDTRTPFYKKNGNYRLMNSTFDPKVNSYSKVKENLETKELPRKMFLAAQDAERKVSEAEAARIREEEEALRIIAEAKAEEARLKATGFLESTYGKLRTVQEALDLVQERIGTLEAEAHALTTASREEAAKTKLEKEQETRAAAIQKLITSLKTLHNTIEEIVSKIERKKAEGKIAVFQKQSVLMANINKFKELFGTFKEQLKSYLMGGEMRHTENALRLIEGYSRNTKIIVPTFINDVKTFLREITYHTEAAIVQAVQPDPRYNPGLEVEAGNSLTSFFKIPMTGKRMDYLDSIVDAYYEKVKAIASHANPKGGAFKETRRKRFQQKRTRKHR